MIPRAACLPIALAPGDQPAGGPSSGSHEVLPFHPTTIGPGIDVTGDVYAGQDLVLQGRVDGSIDVPDHALSVSEGACLRGTAFGRIVSVAGTLVGDITASELVEVLPGASVAGDITAPRVYLDEQATYRGRIDMRRTDAAVRVARYRLDRKAMTEARR